jgi:hypothetical protein
MRSIRSGCALAALIGAAFAVVATPAAAEFFGCNDKNSVRNYRSVESHYASARTTTREFAAQSSRRFSTYSRQNRTRYY